MSDYKFEIGDKVKILKMDEWSNENMVYDIGRIGIIVDRSDDEGVNGYLVDSGDKDISGFWYMENSLELTEQKDNYNKEYWLSAFQNLLDTRYSWFAIDEKDYVDDDKHKKIYNEQEDTVEYFEYKLNKNAKLYQLGFTVKEVQAICRE